MYDIRYARGNRAHWIDNTGMCPTLGGEGRLSGARKLGYEQRGVGQMEMEGRVVLSESAVHSGN